MGYIPVDLKRIIELEKIVTVHYFEYSSSFSYAGESHDFWEFLAVDKGEVEVIADQRCYQMSRGEIIFHKPNEFHRLTAGHPHAPNLVVISFVCHSPAMDFFNEKLMKLDSYERELLAQIIKEARQTFLEPLNNPYQTQMLVRKDADPESLQCIALHLELFLLHLMRRYRIAERLPEENETIKKSADDQLFQQVEEYLMQHLNESLTLDTISQNTFIGRSQLQKLVRSRQHCGVIDYFSQLKIQQAKQLIRNNQMSFTEIAEALGYSSVHYFSRQFKKIAKMTPSEYSSSIQSLSEKH